MLGDGYSPARSPGTVLRSGSTLSGHSPLWRDENPLPPARAAMYMPALQRIWTRCPSCTAPLVGQPLGGAQRSLRKRLAAPYVRPAFLRGLGLLPDPYTLL